MTMNPVKTHRSIGRIRRSLAPTVLTLVLLLSGCATRRQVAEIVVESNAAMLASQFGGLPEARSGATVPPWQEASDRIDAFIAAHPDQKATVAPLRIRQAMLLLAYQQFNLARAAFRAVEPGDLHTDRDKALKRHEDTLVWWFATSANDTWSASDQARAETALRALQEDQARLRESPEIRDYLAEMRAWIGLAAAKQTADAGRQRALVEDALDVYAGVFTPDDLAILASGHEQLVDPKALGTDIRRRVRARAVLTQARDFNRSERLGVQPANTTFREWINR